MQIIAKDKVFFLNYDDIFISFVEDCECPSGFFEDPNGDCRICSFKCLTCEESADKCTSCRQNQYLFELFLILL